MNRVLDYIDQHLDTPLDLPALAALAHFSPYHFHRLFAAWMGETLGDYLRRRRLDVAAVLLAGNHTKPVLEIALSVGFGSGEALARAFKLRFACSPSEWRRGTTARWAEQMASLRAQRPYLANSEDSNLDQVQRNLDQADSNLHRHHDNSRHPDPELSMEVELLTLPPTTIAYMRHIGPYGDAVHTFWMKTFFPWLHGQQLAGQPLYGLGQDDPSITDPEKCRYDAGVEVPADFKPGQAANLMTLPGGRYASAKFLGTVPQVGAAWAAFFREWLPASGYTCDARPVFEYYPSDAKFDPQTGIFNCDLRIPIRPL